MKNSIPFKSDEFCTAYTKALLWLSNFNSNLLPDKKIKTWIPEYKNNVLILKF